MAHNQSVVNSASKFMIIWLCDDLMMISSLTVILYMVNASSLTMCVYRATVYSELAQVLCYLLCALLVTFHSVLSIYRGLVWDAICSAIFHAAVFKLKKCNLQYKYVVD